MATSTSSPAVHSEYVITAKDEKTQALDALYDAIPERHGHSAVRPQSCLVMRPRLPRLRPRLRHSCPRTTTSASLFLATGCSIAPQYSPQDTPKRRSGGRKATVISSDESTTPPPPGRPHRGLLDEEGQRPSSTPQRRRS
eukprot:tig00001302_g8085.t1